MSNKVKFWLWPMSPDMEVRLCQKCLQRLLGTEQEMTPDPCEQGLLVLCQKSSRVPHPNSDYCHWVQPLPVPPRGLRRNMILSVPKGIRPIWAFSEWVTSSAWRQEGDTEFQDGQNMVHCMLLFTETMTSKALTQVSWYDRFGKTEDPRSFLLACFFESRWHQISILVPELTKRWIKDVSLHPGQCPSWNVEIILVPMI